MPVDTSTVGFNKSQIITIENGQKALKVWSPLKHTYDGLGFKAGDVLKDYEGGPDFVNAWCIMAIDPEGNARFYRMNRPGGYGAWQYLTVLDGMIAFHPADDVSFSFLCS